MCEMGAAYGSFSIYKKPNVIVFTSGTIIMLHFSPIDYTSRVRLVSLFPTKLYNVFNNFIKKAR